MSKQNEELMRVVYVEPNKAPRVMEMLHTLEAEQNAVGGLIELVYNDDNTAIVCNDEGKLLGLPLNRALRNKRGEIYDIVSGTFLLCSAPPTSSNFESLSEEQIQKYIKKFKNVEIYIRRK